MHYKYHHDSFRNQKKQNTVIHYYTYACNALTIWIPYIFDFHFVTSRNIISFKEYNHGKKSLLEAILFCFFDVHISMKDAKRVLVFFGTKNEITFLKRIIINMFFFKLLRCE